jgi:hypothetical protein
MARSTVEDRWISIGPGTARLPERLLLSQARGNILFISGAGISLASGMPDFRGLVLEVYRRIDPPVHAFLQALSNSALDAMAYSFADALPIDDGAELSSAQRAEIRRFGMGDYDVVLGMLERRMDGRTLEASRVRQAVANILNAAGRRPAPIHRAIMQLAERGGVTTTLTTNFDLLLEKAMPRGQGAARSYSLGGIPRPGRSSAFVGVLHIHGALAGRRATATDLVLTDHDFGEFYLRRRVVPDLIYDAARLFHLVLVGYSANDAPMRYLLNAVAADGFRFDDLKERFAFVGEDQIGNDVQLEDWKGRGITPISYPTMNGHAAVAMTLSRWAAIAPGRPTTRIVDRELRRIVRQPRGVASEVDRDLFDHFIRRSGRQERNRLAALISSRQAHLDWLDAINAVSRERPHAS